MMENYNMQEKEIEKVSGGVPASYKKRCPSCGHVFDVNAFDLVDPTLELISNGCGKDSTYRYTCPDCKYKWDE